MQSQTLRRDEQYMSAQNTSESVIVVDIGGNQELKLENVRVSSITLHSARH